MLKIGVVLSGCGVMDGAEIHEAVLTLLAIQKNGAEALCMAPDAEQAHVINHLTGQPMPEKRNILVEAARIARGNIKDLASVQAQDLDALIFPGGFGAAKNLCGFAFDGPSCKIHPEVARLIRGVYRAGKPIGAMCIAPALIAKALEGEGVELTIGNDSATAEAMKALGQVHHDTCVTEIWIDGKRKIVSTAAYMLAKNLVEANAGIEKLVREVIAMTGKGK